MFYNILENKVHKINFSKKDFTLHAFFKRNLRQNLNHEQKSIPPIST